MSARAHAGSSADQDKPLPFAVQVPFGFLFLHLPVLSAGIPPLHAWEFGAWTSVTNNFIYSDNAGELLATRTSRAPVTQSDIDTLVTAHPGEDYYFFDGQVTAVYGRFATTVVPSLAVGARFSVIGISGGQGMDGFVEGFHSLFGLGQSYRDVVTRGETTSVLRIDGDEVSSFENPRVGIGDPIVYALWAPEHRMEAWRMSLISAIKAPIGSTSKRLSTGRADFGTAFALTGDLGRRCVNVNGGVTLTFGAR